jgi:hypothetical protein
MREHRQQICNQKQKNTKTHNRCRDPFPQEGESQFMLLSARQKPDDQEHCRKKQGEDESVSACNRREPRVQECIAKKVSPNKEHDTAMDLVPEQTGPLALVLKEEQHQCKYVQQKELGIAIGLHTSHQENDRAAR